VKNRRNITVHFFPRLFCEYPHLLYILSTSSHARKIPFYYCISLGYALNLTAMPVGVARQRGAFTPNRFIGAYSHQSPPATLTQRTQSVSQRTPNPFNAKDTKCITKDTKRNTKDTKNIFCRFCDILSRNASSGRTEHAPSFHASRRDAPIQKCILHKSPKTGRKPES
jgi:hypothetical protein